MRLIDVDTFMKFYGFDKAVKYGNETPEQAKFSYDTLMMYEIADMLTDAETAITYCNDCKRFKPIADGYGECNRQGATLTVKADDFCSAAERRVNHETDI